MEEGRTPARSTPAQDHHDVAAAAEEEGAGLAVLIDEAQDLPAEELTALRAIAHRAMQDDWRVLFALAGLPSLPRILAEAKSYSERFKCESVEALDPELVRDAIVRPARAEQVDWNLDAIELTVAESRGYPYFLQQYGQDAWNAAEVDPITYAGARVGATSGRAALDAGFYRARWDRATPTKKAYLRAMAQVRGRGRRLRLRLRGDRRAPVPEARQPRTGPREPHRQGPDLRPDHGVVAFTVPGMASFITRRTDQRRWRRAPALGKKCVLPRCRRSRAPRSLRRRIGPAPGRIS